MPKELHEISKFMSGTVTVPSETDISDDTASYSLNIDPVAEDGILKGIPTDTKLQTNGSFGTGSDRTLDADKMAMVNNDGQRNVIIYEAGANKIWNITDFYADSAFAVNDMGTQTNSTDTCTMQVNNKEVHIGMGKGTSDKPLWCGIIPYRQFGGSVPTGLQLVDAELKSPVSFSDMHKVVTDDTYIYGIEYGGQILYTFKISDGSLYKKSKPIFENQADLTAIALASDGHIWLFDSKTRSGHPGATSGTTLGILYKIDEITNEIIQENKITLSSNYALHNYSDVLEIGAEIWMSAYKDDATHPEKAYIINFTIPTASGDIVSTNRLPLMRTVHPGTPAYGKFDTASTDDNATLTTFIPYVNLIKLKNTTDYCGFAIDIRDRDVSAGLAQFREDGSTTTNVSSCILSVSKTCDSSAHFLGSAVAGDKNKLFYFASQTTPEQLFTDETTARGYVTSDGTNFIGISRYSPTDAVDDSFVYKVVIPDMDTATNGDLIQTYTLGFTSNIANASFCIADGGSGTLDYHLFSSGDSVGRWSKVDDIGDSFSAGDVEIVLQSDANILLALATATGQSTEFTGNNNYFYKASYIYDGYQESPLSSDFMLTQSSTPVQISISINLFNIATFPKRISHVNLYMAEGDEASSDPTGFYRLVKSIKVMGSPHGVNDQWQEVADDATSPDWGVAKVHEFLHNGNVTASFDALNGMSEVIDNTILNYGLSAQLNNQLFVAAASHIDLDDVDNLLFKSKPYKFDQFDWSVDLLRLPTIPTALASFNGRVYAFGENNTYRIEPNSLYIEDTFEGVGCIGPDAVIVTEYGMCFVDKNNIYLHDGRQPIPIGNTILNGDDKSWQNRDTTWASKVLFDAKRNSFVVLFKYSSNYYAWGFNVSRRRWDLWEVFGTTEPLGILSGRDGEMFISDGTNLKHYLGHASTKRNWDWHSKKLTMGADTQTKVFKRTRVTGNTGDCIDTFVSSEGTPADSGATDGVLDYVYKLSGAASRAKWLQYKITSESNTVDSIGTIFRRRPVK